MPARSITFGDIVRENSRSHPNSTALVQNDVRLTWPELDGRTNSLASALRSAGVGPGDRVLWLGQNSYRVYELLGACAKLGAMVCPGYWRWAPGEMAFAVDDFTPTVVFWQDEEVGETARRARELATHDCLWIQHDSDPDEYERFLDSGDDADPDDGEVDPDSALLVIYTAAITGRQAGSMLSQRNLIQQGLMIGYLCDVGHETAYLNTGPMFHIGNFQFHGLATFVHGGKNVVLRRVDAEEILRLIVEERCTRAFLVPPTIGQVVEANKGPGHDLSHFVPTIGGAAMYGDTKVGEDTSRHARKGGSMGRGFGQTEVSGFSCLAGYASGDIGNAGNPGPMMAVRILDADGNECPIGVVGEICFRGDLVNIGYWNRPEINEQRWRHGWWHSSDAGRREEDGTITFVGTLTRMIKSGVENVFPAEVETALLSHPGVRDVAAIGTPSAEYTQEVKAIVALTAPGAATSDALQEHCRELIASYKKPRHVEFVDEIPRRADGTIDYDLLDEKYDGGGYPGVQTIPGGKA